MSFRKSKKWQQKMLLATLLGSAIFGQSDQTQAQQIDIAEGEEYQGDLIFTNDPAVGVDVYNGGSVLGNIQAENSGLGVNFRENTSFDSEVVFGTKRNHSIETNSGLLQIIFTGL